jgi:hypothetical protein
MRTGDTLFVGCLVSVVGSLVGLRALGELTEAGRARERVARGTLAWWTNRHRYRASDFAPRGKRVRGTKGHGDPVRLTLAFSTL